MTAGSGDILYTTDGSDPRLPGGAINPVAIRIPGRLVEFTGFAAGSEWKYNDDGTDLGTAWRATGYDDSSWPTGPALLGFGTISGTTVATTVNRNLTLYCRRSFELAGAASITDAFLQIQVDDGAVVYLNGTEAARKNMPGGQIDFSTPASDDVPNEEDFDSHSFDPGLLVEGANTIAVEVHNRSTGSSDLGIDIALAGSRLNEANPPIPINTTTTVRARSLEGEGEGAEWSALTEATFVAAAPATPGNLVISEIHYHPSDAQGELSEYIELMNISDQPIGLAGVEFTQGIAFTFSDDATLMPGQRAVLVADPAAFASAYGAGATVLGTYSSRLADGGERLTLSAADGSTLQSLRYDDNSPWPSEPDGDGYSLVLISPESAPPHDLPQSWRASVTAGGNPGTSDAIPFEGDLENDLLAYALGDPAAVGVRIIDGAPVLEFPQIPGSDDATVTVELSSDLTTWRAGEATLLSQTRRSGRLQMRWAMATDGGGRKYARLVVSLNN